MRQWLDGIFQMGQLIEFVWMQQGQGSCLKQLQQDPAWPKPALMGVRGALEAVQPFFILQGGYDWAVISCEESHRNLVLEASSGWLERLYMTENPAFGVAGTQEHSCPSPCPELAPGSPVPWPEVRRGHVEGGQVFRLAL